jgi:hypothetical protein
VRLRALVALQSARQSTRLLSNLPIDVDALAGGQQHSLPCVSPAKTSTESHISRQGCLEVGPQCFSSASDMADKRDHSRGRNPISMERGQGPPTPQEKGKIQGGELQAGVHFA